MNIESSRKENTRHLAFGVISSVLLVICCILVLVGRVEAFSNANYTMEEYSIDAGGDEKSWGSGYEHSAVGQTRGEVNKTADYVLQDGLLYYDDSPPLFPPAGSLDPNFMFWIQNISPSSATFHIHTIDDTVPDASDFLMRTGLNLSKVFYKASPDQTTAGTWGYSDSGGGWHALADGYGPNDWKRIYKVETSLANCQAAAYPHAGSNDISCITETDLTLGDGISYSVAGGAEVIRTTVDFSNHPFSNVVTINSAMIFKIVDMAGNVAFSAPITSTPWLKTEQGDVHSNRKIIMFHAPPEDNVAYMVSAADSITNMDSELGWEMENYPAYLQELEWPALKYDILLAEAEDGGSIDDGHDDGGTITDSDLNFFLDSADHAFDEQGIYYRNGDLTIGNAAGYEGVRNAKAASIIVDGNLNIVDNFILNHGGYLAFIVRGNISISGTVGEIRGTYVADNQLDINKGVINTGDDTASPTQLRVVGQLIARGGFVFNRVYIGGMGTNEPSEIIVYDPQVVINTPPGLKEIPSLGAWEEAIPD